MTNEEIADLIDKAHDELLTRGWCQGRSTDGDGRVCAERAVQDVAREMNAGSTFHAFAALEATLGLNGWLYHWNDDPSRTEDEVFDAFRQTSKRLREEVQS